MTQTFGFFYPQRTFINPADTATSQSQIMLVMTTNCSDGCRWNSNWRE